MLFRFSSTLARRSVQLALIIPIGQSIVRQRSWPSLVAKVQCRAPSHDHIADSLQSKLVTYHDALERARQRSRNLLTAVVYGLYRSIRLVLRFARLSILFGPLLLIYPLVYSSDRRMQWWRGWAFYMTENFGGPALIKLAQWASTRRDLFSTEFCDLFSRLHSSTKPHARGRTERVLREELGEDWKKYFSEFDWEPVGSGCVAQVYKARLDYIAVQRAPVEIRQKFESGDRPWVDVAIKVTHPGIRDQIADDLAILSFLARIARVIDPRSKYVDPQRCMGEFRTVLIRQLDMRYEGDALRIFTEQFKGDESIRFPKPLYQTENILVETYEPGSHISNFITNSDTQLKERLAKIGVNALLKMVFVNNFIHGDLHPGNILVQEYVRRRPRGGLITRAWAYVRSLIRGGTYGQFTYKDDFVEETSTRLVFLDAGISIKLNAQDLKNIRAVFKAVVGGNGAEIADLILRYSPQQNCTDPDAFRRDIEELVSRARSSTVSLATTDVSDLLSDLLSTVSRHQVSLDPNFSGVVMAVLVLEGLGRSLYPKLDLLEEARPILFSALIRQAIS